MEKEKIQEAHLIQDGDTFYVAFRKPPDPQRLNQILKNLLSNAFKFTDRGFVRLEVGKASGTRRYRNPSLNQAREVGGGRAGWLEPGRGG